MDFGAYPKSCFKVSPDFHNKFQQVALYKRILKIFTYDIWSIAKFG
jgi:hypothetical protein